MLSFVFKVCAMVPIALLIAFGIEVLGYGGDNPSDFALFMCYAGAFFIVFVAPAIQKKMGGK